MQLFSGKRVIVYGAGSHALVLRDVLNHMGFPVDIILEDSETPRRPVVGIPVMSGRQAIDEWLEEIDPGNWVFVIAIGNHYGRERLDRHQRLLERGLTPLTAVHPASYVEESAFIGAGAQILCRAVVGSHARLGTQVIINTGAQVDHECRLSDGVHLGPGVTLAGRVCVGYNSFVGAGGTILPDVRIGAHVIVGAGAVVTRDVPDGATVVGVPARPIGTAAEHRSSS